MQKLSLVKRLFRGDLVEEISKKDLLILTGISYGQLYRWKRKGLIPEEWFIKRASFTGQETYFPKDLILDRIDKILELKDELSLEELSEIINNKKIRNFNIHELKQEKIFLNNDVLVLIDNDVVTFDEVIILKIIDNIYDKVSSSEEINKFLTFLKTNINEVVSNCKEIYISTTNDKITSVLTKDTNSLTYNFSDYIKINLIKLIENIKLILMV